MVPHIFQKNTNRYLWEKYNCTMKRELTKDEKQRLKNIGKFLKTCRELSGYSQKELGDKADLNFRTIFRIEHGESITLQSLLSIADALEIEPGEVLIDN